MIRRNGLVGFLWGAVWVGGVLACGGGLIACGGGSGLGTGENNNNVSQDCGNGVLDTGEACDGTLLDGADCGSLGFVGGTLACTTACTFDTAGCQMTAVCGDGEVSGAEECDGQNLDAQTCVTLGWDGGPLGCDASCHYIVSGCTGSGPECGNQVKEYGEQCDGTALAGATCVTAGHVAGEIACDASCRLDTTGCVDQLCGNGTVEGTEACDGNDLDDTSCEDLNFDGGTLDCSQACAFDTSGCTLDSCGNGVLDVGEDCDASLFGGADCESEGYSGGILGCTGNCAFNFASCIEGVCSPGGGALACSDVETGDTTTHLEAADVVDYWTGANCENFEMSGPEVVYSYNPGSSGQFIRASLTDLTADLDLIVLGGAGAGCSDDLDCVEWSFLGGTNDEEVSFNAVANTTYYLVVDGFEEASGPYTLTLSCVDPIRQIYELFTNSTTTPDPWDLTGTTITFTPGGASPAGYTWGIATGVTEYPSPLGSGTTGTPFEVPFTQQDDTHELTFTAGVTFTFFGTAYSGVWVNSHGTLTFTGGDTESTENHDNFVNGLPRIAGCWDLMNVMSPNPGANGVFVERFGDHLAITYDDIEDGYTGNLGQFNAVQIELFPGTGVIRITNLARSGVDGLVGITEGGGPGPEMPEVNFLP